jgi:APA family basic amino acid/polyamine antiporter
VTNAAAWTLESSERRRRRWRAGAGLAGCLVLAVSLPAASVLAGAVVLGVGAAVWAVLAGSRRGSGGSGALPPG